MAHPGKQRQEEQMGLEKSQGHVVMRWTPLKLLRLEQGYLEVGSNQGSDHSLDRGF